MKTQISRDNYKPEKRYSGVYQQQGRMITDSDWNELMEIIKQHMDNALFDVISKGAPRKRGVINFDTNPPTLRWGHVYVDGIQAEILPDPEKDSTDADGIQAEILPAQKKDFTDADPFEFTNQRDFPVVDGIEPSDNCTLYVDVWERPVISLEDPELSDPGLHGADTCTRTQTMAQIKYCPHDLAPETDEKRNPQKGNAELIITQRAGSTESDPVDQCVQEVPLDQGSGNYLFRLEVHDITGPANKPKKITLKWSMENGAKQYLIGSEPADFKLGNWIYEAYNDTTEKHLGVHHTSGNGFPSGFPSRGLLYTDGYPSPSKLLDDGFKYIRRWDGYCEINLSTSPCLVEGKDHASDLEVIDPSVVDSKAEQGDVKLEGNSVKIFLNNLVMKLELNKTFVPGDYWLAAMRENADKENRIKMLSKTPIGITHHYMKLGRYEDGEFIFCDNDSECRRLAFPSLTDMHASDIAYTIPECPSKENQSPTVLSLLCSAIESWPDVDSDKKKSVKDILDALLLHLDTSKIPYDPTNKEARWKDIMEIEPEGNLGTPPRPSTVQEAIDELIDGLESSDIPYNLPSCTTHPHEVPLIKDLLAIPNQTTLKGLWDILLCNLDAAKIPYDPKLSEKIENHWKDIMEIEPEGNLGTPPRPSTVQEAIDELIDTLENSDFRYNLPTCTPHEHEVPLIKDLLKIPNKTTFKELWDILLCNLDAAKIPYDPKLSQKIKNCWEDIHSKIQNEDDANFLPPETVEDAVNLLVQRLMTKGGYITVGQGGEYETLAKVFEKLPDLNYYPLFLLPGEQTIEGSVDTQKKRCIKITGAGASTSMVKIHGDLSLTADEIILRDIGVEIQEMNNTIQLTGKQINTEGCAFRHLIEENNHIWSKNFQGSSYEYGNAIAVDSENNVLITGSFSGEVDFGGGPLTAVSEDLFIAKFNQEGEHIWSKNFQGTSRGYGQAIAIDSENNVLITGYFTGEVDFGGSTLKAAAGQDLFIAKFNQEGECIWSKNFQGIASLEGQAIVAIAIDSENNILIIGYFNGEVDFGRGPLKAKGFLDRFIAKFNQEGECFWSKNFQGSSYEYGNAIAVDSENNILITGYFTGEVDFGGDPLKAAAGWDLFIAKFDQDGEHIWSKNSQGSHSEYVQAIAVDSENNILITGYFTGEVDFGGGPLTAVGGNDLFIAKFDQNGEHIWSKNSQGSHLEFSQAIAVDSDNNVLITSRFIGELNFGGGPLTALDGYNIFIAKFNQEGKHIWSENFDDISGELGKSIAVDSENNVLITGYFKGEVDFGGGPLTAVGDYDLFIAKFKNIDQISPLIVVTPFYEDISITLWSRNFQGTSHEYVKEIAVDSENNVLITGHFGGEVDFGGGPLTAVGGENLFIAKFNQEGEHIWSKSFQGNYYELSSPIAVDSENNVLITGSFHNEVNFGGDTLKAVISYDLFIAKFNQKGEHIWSKNFQGVANKYVKAIAVDSENNVLITGYFKGEVDFGDGPLKSTYVYPGLDLFIAKFDEEGEYIWSKNFGSFSSEYGIVIAVDSENNVLITGYFQKEINFGGDTLKPVGGYDLFIAKFNAQGEHIWSKNFQGTHYEYGKAIAVDSENNVLITGYFIGELDFGGNPLTAACGEDLFIAKFNQEGEHIWSENFGSTYDFGSAFDKYGLAIAVDSENNVLITGGFQGEVNFGGDTLKAVGYDLFVAKFKQNGEHDWSKNYNGTSSESGYAIAADSENNILITGRFSGEIDFGDGPLKAVGLDLFIAKLLGKPVMTKKPVVTEFHWNDNENQNHWVISNPSGKGAFILGPFEALALVTNQINGVIRDSKINGLLTLMHELPDRGSINKIPETVPELCLGKTLHLSNNEIFQLISKFDSEAGKYDAFESIIATNNVFKHKENFLMCGLLTMNGNQFPGARQEADVAATVVGQSGTFVSNQAINPSAKIRRLLEHKQDAVNLLEFEDQQVS